MGKPKSGKGVEAGDHAPPDGTGGIQCDEEAVPSTRTYESLNSIKDDVIGIPCLKMKGVTQLTYTNG